MLAQELNFLLETCAASPVTLLKVGVTENKPDWKALLTIEQAKQLEDLYPDIREYGYDIFK
jgi:hypothetical protein